MPLSHRTDEELVELLHSGNERVFASIYERYWQPLYLHAYRMLQNEDQAVDVVQDLFTNFWDKRHAISIKTSLKGYLYTMVRNHVINALQKSKTRNHHIDNFALSVDSSSSSTEETVFFKELVHLIDREIERLPPKMRVVFEKSRKEGLSHREIAKELGITETSVKTILNRALKIIKRRNAFVALLIQLGM